jgi:hypothetical protein
MPHFARKADEKLLISGYLALELSPYVLIASAGTRRGGGVVMGSTAVH